MAWICYTRMRIAQRHADENVKSCQINDCIYLDRFSNAFIDCRAPIATV